METIPENLRCVIQTSDGPICGYVEREEECVYYKFKSIPYAKPPLKNLRFMPPAPISPWVDILDSTKDAPLPLCFDVREEINGSEDCLYIEVITKNVKPTKLMPVMFWICSCHYTFYIDHVCDPTLIVDKDVVYVRCGSRLGPLGFLSINDISAPANNGLKDIVMALKWVQKNIKQFGGDPSNVTLFGTGTGGSMIHFMILSPMATGLFHKAIMQSSSALNRYAFTKNPCQNVLDLAKELGIQKTDKYEIVEELRRMSASEIMEAFIRLVKAATHIEDYGFDCSFKPCVEDEFEGQPVFLSKSPYTIIRSGNFNKVPIIIGSNNIEASVWQYIKEDFYSDYDKYNKDVSLLVPRALSLDDKLTKNIGQQLFNFYFSGSDSLNEHTRTQFLQLVSDYYFLYYMNKTVRLHSQFTSEYPIYYYIINYAGEWSVPKDFHFLNSIGHMAELAFLFRIKLQDSPPCEGSRDSVMTRRRVIKMWTNFAKYGNPTPDENDPLLQIQWDSVSDENTLNYLSIGSELTKGRNPFADRMAFWDKLHNNHFYLCAMAYFYEKGMQ